MSYKIRSFLLVLQKGGRETVVTQSKVTVKVHFSYWNNHQLCHAISCCVMQVQDSDGKAAYYYAEVRGYSVAMGMQALDRLL